LPEPQISDAELEEISKITFEPERDEAASGTLLSSYAPSSTPSAGAAGAIDRTPARPDTVMSEAQNLARMAITSTPLLGGDNPDLNPSDFSDVTPRANPSATPNPMLQAMTPMRQSTAHRGPTPLRTPVRDHMAINTPSQEAYDESLGSQRLHVKSLRDKLKAGLSSIPRPKNEVKVVMPTDDDVMDVSSANDDAGTSTKVADASDIATADLLRQEGLKKATLRTQSEVLRRGLPRPAVVPVHFAKTQQSVNQIEDLNERATELVKLEMVNLMIFDAISYPTPDVRIPKEVNVAEFNYAQLSESVCDLSSNYMYAKVLTLFSLGYGRGPTGARRRISGT